MDSTTLRVYFCFGVAAAIGVISACRSRAESSRIGPTTRSEVLPASDCVALTGQCVSPNNPNRPSSLLNAPAAATRRKTAQIMDNRSQQSTAVAAAANIGAHKKRLKLLVLGAAAAGKTSFLRRAFYNQFDYERRPTLGSDFYVGKVPYNNEMEVTIQVQFWDTPGTVSKIIGQQNPKGRHQYSASLSDAFFQQADGVMLLYDMTSSTSFTRLLKWYADLMDLFAKTGKRLPIIIVANKLDLFQADKPGARHRPCRVPQRQILGLPKDYCGKDFQYEYSVSTSNNNSAPDIHPQQTSVKIPSGTSLSSSSSSRQKEKFSSRRRSEISSYLVNRENWTSDFSYLESLLHSEDASHPDREMVLLWCMRNDPPLTLYEVSAATGEGVSEAMQALVQLAIEAQQEKEVSSTRQETVVPTRSSRHNQELDLHKRYAPKEDHCCLFFNVPPLFRNCISKARDSFNSYKE